MDDIYESRAAPTEISTATSLIVRAQAFEADAWDRLANLYGPLVYCWSRRLGLRPQDAADVVQETFLATASRLPEFRRNRPGDTFRGWLWTITRNKIRDHFRRGEARLKAVGRSNAHRRLQQVPDSPPEDASDPERLSDTKALLHRALEMIEAEFEPKTWQAFWRAAVDGDVPAEIAEDLGLSVASVYQAKARVLKRLRQEFEGLID